MPTDQAIKALQRRHTFAMGCAGLAPGQPDLGTRAQWLRRAHITAAAIDRLRYPRVRRAAA